MPPGVEIDEHRESKAFKKWEEEHERVVKAGGLHVVGTERHESRRIDNQLRGRSGRQGDAGSTRFYLSLEDDLMRIFGGEQIGNLMDKLKLPEDQPIENALVSKAIEQAQVKVEGFNFDTRKNLVEYDDVANQQREIVYKLRKRVLDSDDLKGEVLEKLKHQVDEIVLLSVNVETNKIDHERAVVSLLEIVPFDDKSRGAIKNRIQKIDLEEELKEFLYKVIEDTHVSREKNMGESAMRQIEKYAYMGSIDHHWIEHIDRIDSLREGVRLRGYAQRDPLVEFKNEAFTMFEGLIGKIDGELSRRLFRIGIANRPQEIPLDIARTNVDKTDAIGLAQKSADETAVSGKPLVKESHAEHTHDVVKRKSKKIGRNDPCWCGSGKKFKKCHYPREG